MQSSIPHWIDGKTRDGQSGRYGAVFDPATGTQQARVAFADPAEVDAAVDAARVAFPAWRDTPITR
ncbi:MAG: aldehyde dehydrogenase family protein, partial [Myxococcota bacterium]